MGMTNERKLLLLGLLRNQDMHGYLLNAHLDGTVPLSLKKPTAYNLLERMEEDGWVSHRDEPTGDRPRRVYSITQDGDAAFLELLRQQLGELTPTEVPGLVSLSFLDCLPASEATELVKRRRAALEERRDAFTGDRDDKHSGSTFFAIDYTRRLLELEAQFLAEVIRHLESA